MIKTIIASILSLVMITPTFAGGFSSGYGRFNQANRVVVIERKAIEFEDLGIRVIGVPVDLLGLDYYYRVQPDTDYQPNSNGLSNADLKVLADMIAVAVREACKNSNHVPPNSEDPIIELEKKTYNILKNNCVGCHTGVAASVGLEIDRPVNELSLEILRSIEDSILGFDPDIVPMPKNKPALLGEEINTIRKYIRARQDAQ